MEWSWPRYKFSPNAMKQGIRQANMQTLGRRRKGNKITRVTFPDVMHSRVPKALLLDLHRSIPATAMWEKAKWEASVNLSS